LTDKAPDEPSPPSALELLAQPWSFIQERLLSPSTFKDACDERGLDLHDGQLELLDSAGILRPLFEIDDSFGYPELRSGTRVTKDAVAHGLVRVRLTNPSTVWPRGPVLLDRLLYSVYQLLAVPQVRSFINAMRLDAISPMRWRFDAPELERVSLGKRLPLTDERLIVWLSVLEPVFLPSVRQNISLPFIPELPEERPYGQEELAALAEQYQHDYFEYRRTVPMKELLERMRATPEELAAQASHWLSHADHWDPLGEWIAVVRLAPWRWKGLRREALIALDFRIAAEMALQFLHKLAREGGADETVYGPEGTLAKTHQYHRLLLADVNREGVLTDFDLSPNPIVLVVIEGKTEQEVVPLVMQELGMPPPPWPIRLHNGHGADSNLTWLYRYAWTFEILEEIPGGFRPSRPLPHIFILGDPEGRRQTPRDREKDRQDIVNKLHQDAETAAGRTLARDLIEVRVRIDAWPASFEFAHFSPHELAAAIRTVAPEIGSELDEELAIEAQSTLPRLSALWHRLRERGLVTRDLDKVELIRVLWPVLRKRIQEAPDEQHLREIPVVASLLDIDNALGQYPVGHFTYVPASPPK
jgi:hypothetical protein